MWKPLFDWFVQLFSGLTWPQFLAEQSGASEAAERLRNVFRNDLYPTSGSIIILATLSAVLVYYFVFNRKTGAGYGYKLKYWFSFFLVTSVVVGALVLIISMNSTESFKQLNPFKFSLALSIVSTLYSTILFFLISLIVKHFSVANRTPF
jgi:hypothetical protein